MHQVLVLLARCTPFNILHDPSSGTGPKVFLVDASDHFISSGVTVDGAFMPYIHKFTFQSLIWGYDKLVSLDVPPKWFVQVVYVFNWVEVCPFFH